MKMVIGLWLFGGLVIGVCLFCGASSPHAPVKRTPVTGEISRTKDNGPWVCASSPGALDLITKWAALHDVQETANAVLSTGSGVVSGGRPVKVLDWKFGKNLVRLQDTGDACWVNTEALVEVE